MSTTFHARPFGRFTEIKNNLRGRKLITTIKTPIFSETVLTKRLCKRLCKGLCIEIKEETQSKLKEKNTPQDLKR